jgi:hypothetical protein
MIYNTGSGVTVAEKRKIGRYGEMANYLHLGHKDGYLSTVAQ